MSLSQVTVIGLGLIGGSLAKALKQASPSLRIMAYARSQTMLDEAIACGAIDYGSTKISDAVKNADAIIFCTPLSTYIPILKEALPHLKPSCIISDAGSAKQCVIDDFQPLLSAQQRPFLVPAHPIAGAETSGFSSANANLYKGKRLIITPTATTSSDAVDAISELWKLTGATPDVMTAPHHDAIYAAVSHTPQWLAFAYGKMLQALPQDIQKVISECNDSSFERFRRIGNSPTAMWDDIFAANQPALRHTIDKVKDALATSLKQLENAPKGFAKSHASLNVLEHNPKLNTISAEAFIYLYVLPVILARALHSVAEPHLRFAGTGFSDFTCMQQIPLPAEEILSIQPNMEKAVIALLSNLKAMV